jgi:hypothetical protein
MWWRNLVSNDFTFVSSSISFSFFTVLFGFCCVIKFLIETSRRYYSHFNKHSYLNVLVELTGSYFTITPSLYKIIYGLKILAAVMLCVSLLPNIATLILVISFVIEIKIIFKFHTSLFLIYSFIILITPGLPQTPFLFYFNLKPESNKNTFDLYFQFLGILPVIVVYWTTAIRKLRSPNFLRGEVLINYIIYLNYLNDKLNYNKVGYPNWFLTALLKNENKTTRFFKAVNFFSIISHFFIPVLLLFPKTQILGFVLGLSLHIFYTFFYPITLLHFSLLMISSYVLFVNPNNLIQCLNMK